MLLLFGEIVNHREHKEHKNWQIRENGVNREPLETREPRKQETAE